MEPSILRIEIVVLMVAAAIILILFLQSNMAAESLRRMTAMIKRVGLDPRIVDATEPATAGVMNAVRQRCARCMHEARCERWLAGELTGDNDFCPNARVFDTLAHPG